jgi:hypothetical protein
MLPSDFPRSVGLPHDKLSTANAAARKDEFANRRVARQVEAE